MTPKDIRNAIANQCGFTPEDHGGNWTPDRIEANYAFSEWLDQQGDALASPTSFSEWLSQNGDSI